MAINTEMEQWLKDKYVVAGTGSKQFVNDPDVKHKFEILKSELHQQHYLYPETIIMSGGAEGWDEAIAKAAHDLNIPYVMIFPSLGYISYYWIQHSVTGRNRIDRINMLRDGARHVEYTFDQIYIDGVHANFLRNQRMVDLADEIWTYENPDSSGTKDCLRKARKAGLPITTIC